MGLVWLSSHGEANNEISDKRSSIDGSGSDIDNIVALRTQHVRRVEVWDFGVRCPGSGIWGLSRWVSE